MTERKKAQNLLRPNSGGTPEQLRRNQLDLVAIRRAECAAQGSEYLRKQASDAAARVSMVMETSGSVTRVSEPPRMLKLFAGEGLGLSGMVLESKRKVWRRPAWRYVLRNSTGASVTLETSNSDAFKAGESYAFEIKGVADA